MGKSKNAMSIRKIGKNDLQRYFELCNEENWGIGFARIEKMVLEGIFYCYEIGAQPVSFVGCYILVRIANYNFDYIILNSIK